MILSNIRRVYILGDLHLGVRNNSVEWSEIQSQFLLDFFLQQVDSSGFDPERDVLFQVGDWNHVRESTNVRIHQASIEIAEKLCNKFKKGVYVILGNHDVYYKDRTDTHSLKGYDLMFKNFYVFEKPKSLTINQHKILLLPWNEDHTELKNVISQKLPDIVFCHADFKGFSLNKVTKLEHGLELSEISQVKRIYSGHIHIRQEKGNVLYVGTPYEMDRGDRGNTKGFYYVDLSGNKIKETFVENTFSPKYVKFNLYDVLQMSQDSISTVFKNNFVDLTIEASFASKFPLTRFTELVKECGHRKIEFFSYSKDEVTSSSEIELNSNYEYNIFTTLNEKLKSLNLPEYKQVQISNKFKEIYDSLKNTKSYE
jgi:UDP-2,3-diacylglucosamine pyrophosphatase LpxH